jgi:cytochrome c-type biogenesis protein CcmH/NrfG
MASDPAQAVAGDLDERDEALALAAEAQALLAAGRVDAAVRVAHQATVLGILLEPTWRVLAEAFEARGDLPGASAAYSQAASLAPDRKALNGPMGRLALRMGEYPAAERLLTAHLQENGLSPEAIADLARAQAQQLAFDRAHELLKAALEADPGQAQLWVALGELLRFEGRDAQSVVFFQEAMRLDPHAAAAQSGLADALLASAGDLEQAVAAGEAAVATATPAELPNITAVHARRLLAAGRLAAGWTAHAKAAEPGPAALIDVRVAAPRWAPGAPSDGPLLVVGEENLIDDVLLAQVVPGLIAEGRPLILAVAPGWQALARRSFPQASVVPLLARSRGARRQLAADLDAPHLHDGRLLAAWRPLRDIVADRRAQLTDFAPAGPYLTPDPDRIRHWRDWLSGLGPGLRIGVRWRQPLLDVARPCEIPTLPDLQDPLSVPGLRLISLQGGEIQDEAAWIREALGLTVHEPPELDHGDLDDLAALACALDVVVGSPGAVTYAAAACGATVWFLSPPGRWAMLGEEAYPWFPEARVIFGDVADWGDAMHELGQSLYELAGGAES